MEWWGYLVLFTIAGGPWYVYYIYRNKVHGEQYPGKRINWPW